MNIGTVSAGGGGVASLPALTTPTPTVGGPAPSAGAGRASGGTAAGTSACGVLGAVLGASAGGALGAVLGAAGQSASARQAEALGGILAKLVRGGGLTALTTTGKAAGSASSAGGAASGSLAFLKDKRLSVEERLARLMVLLSDKYEKQLEEKLNQYAALEGGGRAASTGGTPKGGSSASLLGGIEKVLSKVGITGSLKPGGLVSKVLGQVAGPVLAGAATALGFPALAPAILKAGPALGALASGALAEVASGTGKPTKASTSSSASGGSASASSAPSEKALMTEIQILQEKQKEMFGLVSNILRSMHETKMAVIGNLR